MPVDRLIRIDLKGRGLAVIPLYFSLNVFQAVTH